MLIRVSIAAAILMAVPPMAYAQVARAPAAEPTRVEIVATGQVEVPATTITATVTYRGEGKDRAAADAAKAAKYASILAALQQAGLPSSALTRPAEDDDVTTVLTRTAILSDTLDEKSQENEPAVSLDSVRITMKSSAQLADVRAAMRKLDLQLTDVQARLDDPSAARQAAKAKALAQARSDAAAYGKELGMRPLRIARISESGNSLLLPGVQAQLDQMMTAGPLALRHMFEAPTGTVRVSASIIVDFVMAP